MFPRLKLAGFMALLSLAVSTGSLAQSKPAPLTAAPSESPGVPSFEVATIKPDTSGNGMSHSGFARDSDRFVATNVTIKGLLRFEAFYIADARIVGGPKWLDSARFDIEAELDSTEANHLNSLAHDEKDLLEQALIQKLLADRFQFKSHWEDREQPVYELVVAKGGAKLQPAADTKHGSSASLNFGRFQGKNVTLGRAADLLTQGAGDDLGRVVIDHSGIEGAFDFDLKWAPDSSAASSDAPTGPSLFTAIQEQLGLKLEPAKAPVKVLVIDHLEMPSDN